MEINRQNPENHIPAEVDLHIHSTFSDGEWSPEQIGEYAIKTGLKAISITGHNTIEGSIRLNRYLKETKQSKKLESINGIEITTQFNDKKFHLLTYMYNTEKEKPLKKIFTEIETLFTERRKKVIKDMEYIGFNIPQKTMTERTKNHPDDYPVIKNILENKANLEILKKYGITKKQEENNQHEEFFKKFISYKSPHHIRKKIISFKKAKKNTRKAEGLLVIAHPFSSYIRIKNNMLIDLINQGIDGIECYSVSSNPEKRRYIEEITKKYELINTGGTDFHTPNNHYTIGGFNPENRLTKELINQMKNMWNRKYG